MGAGGIFLKKETYPAGKGNEIKGGKKKKINNDTYLGAGGREREGLKKRGKKGENNNWSLPWAWGHGKMKKRS